MKPVTNVEAGKAVMRCGSATLMFLATEARGECALPPWTVISTVRIMLDSDDALVVAQLLSAVWLLLRDFDMRKVRARESWLCRSSYHRAREGWDAFEARFTDVVTNSK